MAEINKNMVQEILNTLTYDDIVFRVDDIMYRYIGDIPNEHQQQLSALLCAKYLTIPHTVIKRIPVSCGHFMNISDFIYECEKGNLNDIGGFACYAENDGMGTECFIKPNWVKNGFIRTDFDYVIWINYNKKEEEL